MLTPQEQDKKLVKQYKKTNKILRKQLQSLNEQIDNLILQKSNRIGLQKLPKVQKQITDAKIIHYQVENLKKRLQHIKHDNDQYKKKTVVDWLQKHKELQKKLEAKISEKDEVLNKIKVYEKKLKQEKSEINLRKEEDKILQKIKLANQELSRIKKIQRELKNHVQAQKNEDNKKNNTIQELETQQQKILQKSQALPQKKFIQSQENSFPKGELPDNEWQKLKKDFLELKQSKQQEEIHLYEQNDRLRKQIKFLTQQIKVKKNRVDVVRKYNNLETEKKLSSRLEKLAQRNTIDVNNHSESRRKKGFSSIEMSKHQSVRYRDRNNSISYD